MSHRLSKPTIATRHPYAMQMHSGLAAPEQALAFEKGSVWRFDGLGMDGVGLEGVGLDVGSAAVGGWSCFCGRNLLCSPHYFLAFSADTCAWL